MNRLRNKLIILTFVLLTLPFFIYSQQFIVTILSRAIEKKANIAVDVNSYTGEIKNGWLNFAQGGEEPPPMLHNSVTRMKLISPYLIRLDHIFDYYGVLSDDGSYNFQNLDETVEDIINMGAIPFFSLSYMPKSISSDGTVTGKPRNWQLWQELIKKTIEHYSGKNNKNLTGVYYEVWNEPELVQFGSYKLNGNKNYNELYYFAAKGAQEAVNVNKFYIGGPAVGSYYPLWVDGFLTYINENKLRLDFYSWHRYHTDPRKFAEDAQNIRNKLAKYNGFSQLPLILSEWGIDSGNNGNNNTAKAAAFSMATVFKTYGLIDQLFAFEVKDGPPPGGGKWGLMTHEKDQKPLFLKPRFKAFSASTKLTGTGLKLAGEGTYISGMAVKAADNTINLLLTNYDKNERNWENVPVTFTGIKTGSYQLTARNITVNSSQVSEVISINGEIKKEILMLPNSVIYLELKEKGKLSEFIKGAGGTFDDRALVLAGTGDLLISRPESDFSQSLQLSFNILPFWEKDEKTDISIVMAQYQNTDGGTTSLSLKKTASKGIDFLLLTLNETPAELRLSYPIENWSNDAWHDINLNLTENRISLSVDGNEFSKEILFKKDLKKLESVYFFPFNGALDNVKISADDKLMEFRNFD
ncbi:hypothetical protein A3D05_05190 [Candidatus Gottesmanbacteria bacterium RIFCSPHIGHO2_02_FULL_40_24]|uniref:Glycosyl hydrolases family 39 N-terminal catalytic domain-containing protein n=1 Tax=Candidatus Gottesmanbacteria bacterium RIFCSPHIGHO2_01_FULL_40_15 TaxID=1798376 RepID=A0A1F5Z723_9BACT|nr:MAG: hypothetical protein A2777_01825 [Candidatus Gottesmanbacteria bacterium RIFCSPHIGHO2_01_FULL_40_15]OGG16426.1 MAG: hypothetical protein A3D05_05190 [Candidatus Gottesmanbacteria bacterium RIFCSPHIGHO2_02_FULL_40_24]OGG22708.1 MAG: hypothetical protein A3B48_02820 [Candidatus Gottesmanbacteria bacterium RIFCSPLOWO2_01_FULL_40_10]OGG25540.1 MAG: hypothetical protein A3E42_04340 [Candidatus Gottesmanbacteria bacterium RIFCSPHIGHO2_12_FULL_40_13]